MKKILVMFTMMMVAMVTFAKDIKTVVFTTTPQMHCEACENKIKEETTATSRCMPFEQEKISDVCVCCGKPAKKLVYWGKAY